MACNLNFSQRRACVTNRQCSRPSSYRWNKKLTTVHEKCFASRNSKRCKTINRKISITGQIVAKKITDEENRTVGKSHCEPVERHHCNIHSERRLAVCHATTTTTTTSVGSLTRRSVGHAWVMSFRWWICSAAGRTRHDNSPNHPRRFRLKFVRVGYYRIPLYMFMSVIGLFTSILV